MGQVETFLGCQCFLFSAFHGKFIASLAGNGLSEVELRSRSPPLNLDMMSAPATVRHIVKARSRFGMKEAPEDGATATSN